MLRYMQQIAVPEMGVEGQRLITDACVLVIGAGGLGTPVAIYLAAAGVGTIGIIDGDEVTESNLSRQFMYFVSDVGKNKSELLTAKLVEQNPAVKAIAYPEPLEESKASDLIRQFDIICD
jgi:molybdopterin/thiamine biosynthesis adenylyltransferase